LTELASQGHIIFAIQQDEDFVILDEDEIDLLSSGKVVLH